MLKILIIINALYTSLAFAEVNGQTEVAGNFYKKIIQTKDVMADVLPPPSYIIESYLTALILVDELDYALNDKVVDTEEAKKISDTIEYLRQLKEGVSGRDRVEGYFERIKLWQKELKSKDENVEKLKKLMFETAYSYAQTFYNIVDTKLIPAIKSGNLEAAKKIRTELKEAYNGHRKANDEIILIAKKDIVASEESLKSQKINFDVSARGAIYNRIILMKDLISDILPPICFTVESYLLSREMVFEVETAGLKRSFEQLKERSQLLEKNFLERYDYWKTNLESKKLKTILVGEPLSTGKKFYKIRNEELLPALERGNLLVGKKILREKMSSVFNEHHLEINKLVAEADAEYIQLEMDRLAAKKKRKIGKDEHGVK